MSQAKELPQNGVEPEKSEDDIQREQFGLCGITGASDPARMTPQRDKKTPGNADPGHTARTELIDRSEPRFTVTKVRLY
jgi:hypothetical protein